MSENTVTEQTTQVYSIFIRATPEQVWDAITKPEFTKQYFYGSAFDSTLERGARCAWNAEDGSPLVEGEVIEATAPSKLVTTWQALWMPDLAVEPPSRVSWEIEPQEGGVTKLTVVHDQLDESPKTAENVAGGWELVLSGAKTVLETGEPLERR